MWMKMKDSRNPFVNAIYLGLRDWKVLAARATRPQFWFFVLAVVIFSSVALLVAFLLDLPFVALIGFGPFSFVVLLVSIALVAPSVSITVRRLHDAGSSPAWAWVGLGVSLLVWPIIGVGFFLVLGALFAANEAVLLIGLGLIWSSSLIALGFEIFLLVLLVRPSSSLDSRYGPAPVTQPAPPAQPEMPEAATPNSDATASPTGEDPGPATEGAHDR
ncbi:MAG: DUF805 domain-containing protein [Actinomycetia bacterium]|nr:DUF805 domain-containing protein [Actinomycetes bacterium]